jgi:hypothetical protein
MRPFGWLIVAIASGGMGFAQADEGGAAEVRAGKRAIAPDRQRPAEAGQSKERVAQERTSTQPGDVARARPPVPVRQNAPQKTGTVRPPEPPPPPVRAGEDRARTGTGDPPADVRQPPPAPRNAPRKVRDPRVPEPPPPPSKAAG